MIVIQQSEPSADYSAVSTRDKAWDLVEQGTLVALPMLPALFGGDENDDRNIVFVPPAVADRKERIDDEVVLPLVEAGKVVEYAVTPQNDARSFVPLALDITISSPETHFYRLTIWAGSGR